MNNVKDLIEILDLKPHPEGGYFKEVFKSGEKILAGLPERFDKPHSFYTSIYYLLVNEDVSSFHILKSDEIWHFYAGSALMIHIISPEGKYSSIKLGNKICDGQVFQFCVKSGNIFAAEVIDKKSFSLVGCTVSPGFEFDDFTLCSKSYLVSEYPEHKNLINRLAKK